MTFFGSPELGLDMFHVGLVVEDLMAAMAEFGATYGHTWAAVRPPAPRDVIVDGRRQTCEVLATYSLQGPPYLELVEERSGSVWGADGCSLNHIGFWAPDLTAAVERFELLGARPVVHDAGPGNRPSYYSYHRMGSGLWTELVSVDWRPRLEEWLGTGVRP